MSSEWDILSAYQLSRREVAVTQPSESKKALITVMHLGDSLDAHTRLDRRTFTLKIGERFR